MPDNTWAEPEGFEPGAAPTIAYRILDRDRGELVTRQTQGALDWQHNRFYLSLDMDDQGFANAIAEQVQAACAYFYHPQGEQDDYVPLAGWADSRATDDEVRARIHRLNNGENAREAERTRRRRYPLDELPWQIQRALIEQIDRIKAEWQFELIGELPLDSEPASP